MLTEIPTIEKNVPVPLRKGSGTIRTTLQAMEVGDSFLLNSTNPQSDMTTIRKAAKATGIKVTARVENGSFRVWRLE